MYYMGCLSTSEDLDRSLAVFPTEADHSGLRHSNLCGTQAKALREGHQVTHAAAYIHNHTMHWSEICALWGSLVIRLWQHYLNSPWQHPPRRRKPCLQGRPCVAQRLNCTCVKPGLIRIDQPAACVFESRPSLGGCMCVTSCGLAACGLPGLPCCDGTECSFRRTRCIEGSCVICGARRTRCCDNATCGTDITGSSTVPVFDEYCNADDVCIYEPDAYVSYDPDNLPPPGALL